MTPATFGECDFYKKINSKLHTEKSKKNLKEEKKISLKK